MYGIEAGKPREDLLGLVFGPRHLGCSYSLSIATLKAGSWPVGLRQPFLAPWSYELSASHWGMSSYIGHWTRPPTFLDLPWHLLPLFPGPDRDQQGAT